MLSQQIEIWENPDLCVRQSGASDIPPPEKVIWNLNKGLLPLVREDDNFKEATMHGDNSHKLITQSSWKATTSLS